VNGTGSGAHDSIDRESGGWCFVTGVRTSTPPSQSVPKLHALDFLLKAVQRRAGFRSGARPTRRRARSRSRREGLGSVDDGDGCRIAEGHASESIDDSNPGDAFTSYAWPTSIWWRGAQGKLRARSRGSAGTTWCATTNEPSRGRSSTRSSSCGFIGRPSSTVRSHPGKCNRSFNGEYCGAPAARATRLTLKPRAYREILQAEDLRQKPNLVSGPWTLGTFVP